MPDTKVNFKLKEGLKLGSKGKEVIDLKNYLSEFGYLSSDKENDPYGNIRDIKLAKTEGEKFDEVTKEALKDFQKVYGLKVTGELTVETAHLMSIPRCGFPDMPKLYDPATGQVAYFVIHGNKWNRTNVTYAFQNFTGDLVQSEIINAIRQAFLVWSKVCFLTFTERTGYADILIKFAAGNHGDDYPFDGPSGVLAHAFFPPPNSGDLAGDLHFDDAEKWSLNLPPSGFDLLTVAIHEIGHTLGLAHSNVASSVMYPYYSGVRRNLHADDINGIVTIYGAKAPKAVLSDTAIGQPAFTSLNNMGFIAWTGTNQAHNLNVMATKDLRVWFDKCTLNDTSLSGPSITAFNNKLYLAYRGVGNNRLHVISSADGKIWVDISPSSKTTYHSPSLAVYNGKLYLAWTDTTNQRLMKISHYAPVPGWSPAINVGSGPNFESSIDGPSICSKGGILYLAWINSDNKPKLNIIRYNGTTWTPKNTYNDTSYKTPNIFNTYGTILMTWMGTDAANRLNVWRSTNGINFVSKVTYNDTSYFAPNLSSFNGQNLLLWTGKDNARSLNVMTI